MTSTLFILALAASVAGAQAPIGVPGSAAAQPNAVTAQKNSDNELIPPGLIDFQGVDINQVLEVYARLEGKTLLRSSLPPGQIVLENDAPLTRAQAIHGLEAVLALHGVAVIDIPGGKFIKEVPVEQAGQTGELNPNQPPELGLYLDRIVKSEYIKPSEVLLILRHFTKSPNAILPMDADGILVLHDNAKNVRRMAETVGLANFIYQSGNDAVMTRVWQGLDARIRLVAACQKTPGKNLRNATASAQ